MKLTPTSPFNEKLEMAQLQPTDLGSAENFFTCSTSVCSDDGYIDSVSTRDLGPHKHFQFQGPSEVAPPSIILLPDTNEMEENGISHSYQDDTFGGSGKQMIDRATSCS